TLLTYDKDAQGNTTHFVNSRTQVIGQIDSPQNGEHNDLTTKYINDQFGEVKEEIDPQGDDTRYTYNAFGEQVSVSDPMGESTTYNYDVNTGNLLSTTDPLRRTTSFQYFSTGDLKSITSGAGPGSTRSDLVTTSFNYNADGDLLNTTDNSGVTWTLSPDAN